MDTHRPPAVFTLPPTGQQPVTLVTLPPTRRLTQPRCPRRDIRDNLPETRDDRDDLTGTRDDRDDLAGTRDDRDDLADTRDDRDDLADTRDDRDDLADTRNTAPASSNSPETGDAHANLPAARSIMSSAAGARLPPPARAFPFCPNPRTIPTVTAEPPPTGPQQYLLNKRYRLLSPIGAGGMAVVYKAQDLALGRLVAVKILREPLTADPDFLARFQQEARAAANLAHPNIVTVHDFGRDGGRNYIVMEYIEGKDLKTLIKDGSPFKVERALDLIIQICAGIGYAHRAGLVHCDVKPQNILVTADGRVKVTDFGIARALASLQPGETTDVVWGSPQYYSPEQAAGEAPTPASDVYSIGVVLYEMLAGRLPFVASTQQALAMMHLRDEPPRLTLFNPALPETLERIVHKVLAKEPSARYRTADQLGRILISYRERGLDITGGQLPTGFTPPSGVPRAVGGGALPPLPEVLPEAPTVYRQPMRGEMPAGATVRAGDASGNGLSSYNPEALDWVAVSLGFLAFIAVVGLIPFWTYVISVYLRR